MNSTDQFEAIVREHYEPLFGFAMSLARVETDAWDLTQQTFYVWATKGHQLRDRSKVKTWLFTTLHRAFLVAQRKQSRYSHDEPDDHLLQLPSTAPEIAQQSEYFNILPALSKVDEVYQAAVVLYYLKEYSYKDITAALGLPLGTVKSRISRGLAQLRELLLPAIAAGEV